MVDRLRTLNDSQPARLILREPLVITAIVIFSLWPLRRLTYRFVGREQHRVHLRLTTTDPHRLGAVVETISVHGGAIAHLASAHAFGTGLSADIEARLPDVAAGARLTAAVANLDGVELTESRAVGD